MSQASQSAAKADQFLGFRISPLTRRRLHNFRANRRGFWSLWVFLAIFVVTLFAEFVANDKPFLVYFDGGIYTPIFKDYPETAFGGSFETAADYRDPFVAEKIAARGWMIWPLVRYHHRTVAWDLPVPAPAPPDAGHRRPGPGRGRAAHIRLPHFGAVRLRADRD